MTPSLTRRANISFLEDYSLQLRRVRHLKVPFLKKRRKTTLKLIIKCHNEIIEWFQITELHAVPFFVVVFALCGLTSCFIHFMPAIKSQ